MAHRAREVEHDGARLWSGAPALCRWTWVPAVVFPLAIGAVWLLPNNVRYEPPHLLPILNGVFLTLASFLVSVAAARTFMVGGSPGMLLLGGGMLIAAIATPLTAYFLPAGRVNTGVTTYTTSMLLTAVGQAWGMLLLGGWMQQRWAMAVRWCVLGAAYATAAGLALLVIRFAEQMPPFVIPGQGSTLLRGIVQGGAVAHFAGVAVLMLVRSRRPPSAFLHWYGLGLLLLAMGLTGAGLTSTIGSPLTWVGRAAQYSGGVYLVVAISIAVRQQHGWMLPLDLLLETRKRYDRLVEQSPDAILVHAEGKWVFANAAAAALLGAESPTDLIGRDVLAMVHHDHRPAVEQRIAESYQSGTPTPVRCATMLRLDGSTVEVEATGVGVQYEGRPAVQLMLRDVTARQEAQNELERNRKVLVVALEAADMGTWEYTFANQICEYGPRAQHLYGLRSPLLEHNKEGVQKVIHPDDIPGMWEAVQAACDVSGSGRYHTEYRVRRPEGGWRWLSVWGIVEFADHGGVRQPVRMIGASRDITEQKQTLESLHQAKAAAENANRAKDRFLAVLSHELRTPLNPALMAATILERNPLLDRELREEVSIIRRHIELEARLIDDLLDLTRVAHGKVSLARRIVDGRDVIQHAVATCQAEAAEKQISLGVTLPMEAIDVDVDPARLQQVFWNLLKNAIKFTPQRGVIRVSATVTPDRGMHVEVSDTGRGIANEALSLIFNAFEQGGDDTTRRYGGLGLGLAICKGLVAMHDGRIWATSEGLGRGATFVVELPPPVRRTEAPPDRPALSSVLDAAAKHGHRILLVEDHETTAAVTARLLRSMGHVVIMANCVRAGLELFRSVPFDLVISDLGLPDGSGQDLMRELIMRHGPVPGIALSGYGMESDVEQSIRAGFMEHLTKPINVGQLEQAIARVMTLGRGSAAAAGAVG